MQRRSQPSSSSLAEDVKEERCCGMENWGVIALEIEHMVVAGEGGCGVWHPMILRMSKVRTMMKSPWSVPTSLCISLLG